MYAASFSKVAFAYLAMELVDDGTLDLDKPIYQYLPKLLPQYSGYSDLADDPRYKRITARMLLSHTGGFANFRWVDDDKKLRIHFEPGSRFADSGEGIDLLQLVIETITKEPLDQLMRERIFQPLGMTRTSMLWRDSLESDYANGYDEYGRSLGPDKRSKAEAAGSMVTTISDFAWFMQAVMEEKLLRSKTRAEMLKPQIQILSKHEFPSLSDETTEENKAIRLSYGLGNLLDSLWEAFFKQGHDVGWRNYTVCLDSQRTDIIMTNSGQRRRDFQRAAGDATAGWRRY